MDQIANTVDNISISGAPERIVSQNYCKYIV